MKINNLKAKNQGFTIVELLIVIVVIGILAAITIVSYAGITARANGTKAQTNGANVQKVVEAFNADKGYYPALAATGTDSIGTYTGMSKVPTGITVIPDAATSTITATNGLTTVGYACLTSCASSSGGRIAWWNFGLAAPAVQYIYVGSGSSAGVFVYPAT
jgi:prepilin-type N-terminal cleavage/methylation domain-containing protein